MSSWASLVILLLKQLAVCCGVYTDRITGQRVLTVGSGVVTFKPLGRTVMEETEEILCGSLFSSRHSIFMPGFTDSELYRGVAMISAFRFPVIPTRDSTPSVLRMLALSALVFRFLLSPA